jgi:DNA-binding GntR family transcriptional regulator
VNQSEASAPGALIAVGGRTSLRDEAIQTLHAAIISGILAPGVVYSAPNLAGQLSMSATPVRQAMLDLVKEGLVETVRNKGFRVVELSDAELDELTELRVLIEVPSLRRIATRGITKDEYHELRSLAEQIEQTAEQGDMIAHNKADLAFHTRLLTLLGNTALVDMVRSLRMRSRLYGQAQLANIGALQPSAHEHIELLDLVNAQDGRSAAKLMRQHIGHVRGAWATGALSERDT